MEQLIATFGVIMLFAFLLPLIYVVYISIRIIQKAGYSGWWFVAVMIYGSIMSAIFPNMVGFILGYVPMWLFAFVLKWPADAMASSAPTMEASMQQAPAEQKMDDTNPPA